MSGKTSESFFERMSRTETYASRKMKERRSKVKQDGRPLFNVEVEAEPSPTNSTITRSSTNSATIGRTFSSDASVKSNYSRSSARGGNVFDRLASTGTKSSIRKSKMSEDYDTVDEGTRKNTLIRKFEGNTLLFGGK